jgi:hypothetical protein
MPEAYAAGGVTVELSMPPLVTLNDRAALDDAEGRRPVIFPVPVPSTEAASPLHPAIATRDAARVVTEAETNSFALLLALREADSPLDEVPLHPGILGVTSMIADGCDSPGIEPCELEVLLRSAIYLDRLRRSVSA